ncbi:hypothetical protein [Salinithrix halophila]|uniref:DUF4262 domain-containing protein n=1 Tax=Salinithrix halophila TaxID=1485204 RepID=A0ABV8JIE4_9BACL
MNVEFYEHWGAYWKEGINKLSYEQAKQFHQQEKPYVVILSGGHKPQFIVGINFNYEGYFCELLHLNETLDAYLVEAYEAHGNQLFLKNVHEKYYDDREIDMVTYLYEADGRYRKNFFIDGKGTNTPEYGECDVSSHFREMLQFNRYDSILPDEAKKGLQEG